MGFFVTEPSVSEHLSEHKELTPTTGLASSIVYPPPEFWVKGHCSLYTMSLTPAHYTVCYTVDLYLHLPCMSPEQSPLPPYLSTSPPSTPYFSIFYFFFFRFLLNLYSCLSIRYHSTRILPLRIQVACRRKRLNMALVFCVDFMLYVFLVKDVCSFCCISFSFVLRCDSCLPCCRR